jgi:predicted alpha/beta-hydrolase family hydrolase
MTRFLFTGAGDAPATFLLAHGAGAPMDSPFMQAFADLLAQQGFRVARFEFAYMAARRDDGKESPPPRAERLTDEFHGAIADLDPAGPLVIGGKSLGGRVASMIAQKAFETGRVAGLLCLGYPFHPPGRPDSLRTAHLVDLTLPALIVQGERDPFGGRDEVPGYELPSTIALHWAVDGDHGLKPRKASGLTEAENWRAAAGRIAEWVRTKCLESVP